MRTVRGQNGNTGISGSAHASAEFTRVLEAFIRLSSYFLVPAAGAYVLFSHAVIQLLFPAYSEASAVMPILAGGSLLFGMTYLFSKPFELVKKPSRIVLLLSAALCVNILLNALFIPLYGIIGAAASTLIACAIYAAGSYLLSLQYIRYAVDWLFLLRSVLCAILAGAAAHLPTLFLPLDLNTWPIFIASASVYAAVYVLLSYLLKTVRAVHDIRLS